MVAWMRVWEEKQVLPRIGKSKFSTMKACLLLLKDDTGDVDAIKAELAVEILKLMGYSDRVLV